MSQPVDNGMLTAPIGNMPLLLEKCVVALRGVHVYGVVKRHSL